MTDKMYFVSRRTNLKPDSMKDFIMTSGKRGGKGALLTSVLLTLALCGCGSDNDDVVFVSKLTDAEWGNVKGAIFLNDEVMKGATARFDEIPGSDSVRMVLSGLHPEEDIEMNVAAVRDDNGNIAFEGEQTVWNVRELRVKGIYSPEESLTGTMGTKPMVRVNVTYTVPNKIFSGTYTIRFDDDNGGFRYFPERGTYPGSKPPTSPTPSDSCKFICDRINSELAGHLKSLSFAFDGNGQMTLAGETSGSGKSVRTFRYWVGTENSRDYIHIDSIALFYESLLNVLAPAGNRIPPNIQYNRERKSAILFIRNDVDKYENSVVTLVDEMHNGIFPYLYYMLPTDGAWTAKDKDCFNTMIKKARRLDPESPGFYYTFSWAFLGTKQ